MKNTLTSSQFSAGDWIQVRSKVEILATLDTNGMLDGLPFMPEMFEYCDKRFRVFRRAHKTCDPPNGLDARKMLQAVHLENVRCDGAAHGGCQAACLMFWKDAWLQKSDGADLEVSGAPGGQAARSPGPCTEAHVWAATTLGPQSAAVSFVTFVCQSTRVAAATNPLRWWDIRQYLEDYTSRNVSVRQLLGALTYFVCDVVANAGVGVGSAVRCTYDMVQRLLGHTPYPARPGTVASGVKTPIAELNLEVGEIVKVRAYQDILATITEERHNRGMVFDPEMVPYCGGIYRVLRRVETIIDEKTGTMIRMKTPCIQLDQVVCKACYAKHRKFCPRSIYPYWREVWLERVEVAK